MPKVVKKPDAKSSGKRSKASLEPDEGSRPILHENVTVELHRGSNSLSADDAKELLGWEEEGATKFDEYLLTDYHGKKVRCNNNLSNRPYDKGNAATVKQQILRKKWRLNGESIIIGKTGMTLSAQHRLTGLILAVQEWRADPTKWPDWPDEPTIDCLLVFGIEEDDETINTLDTAVPRSFAHVLFRSSYFANLKGNKSKKVISSICDYAVRCLWHRTGAKTNAYAPIRTHAESIDFIEHHPKLLAAVRHIFEEDLGEGQNITKWIKPGMASGLLYLMASSTSDRSKYYSSEAPSEKHLKFELWDEACDFWVLLNSSEDFIAVRSKIQDMVLHTAGSQLERAAVIVKAWNTYIKKEAITIDDLELDYINLASGVPVLSEVPTVGGIDIGRPEDAKLSEPKPTIAVKTPVKTPTRAGGKKAQRRLQASGDTVYVTENGLTWQGELVRSYQVKERTFAEVKDVKGRLSSHPIESISLDEPL